MSLYFPSEQEDLLTDYSAICSNQRYTDFLEDYFVNRPHMTISFADRGYDTDGQLSFTLAEQTYSYVQSVGYELHSYAGSELAQKLYAVGTDNDVSLANGIYTVLFDGEWVYLNDMLLHCDVYEEKENYTIFSAPVLINGESASLLFTYFTSTQGIEMDGYLLSDDTTSRIHDLTDGTEICVIYKDPLADNDSTYYEEGRLVWDEDTTLAVRKLNPGRYQYIPYVVDIYGKVFYADTATVYFDGTTSVIESIGAG